MRRRGATEVRPLDPAADCRQLATFKCRDFRYPWTDVVEELVREHLADNVAAGHVRGLCVSEGSWLCAVAAYFLDDATSIVRSQLLAVQDGYVRQGHGRRLKLAVIEAARAAGARAVLSTVHVDNDPMLRLNVGLGAVVERIPDDPEHCHCVIPL